MLHVTTVRPSSGLNVNSAVLIATNGRTNSSLILTSSPGRLSVIVMRPSPTVPFPAHAKTAPVPDGAPSNVFLADGSSFAHGDHPAQLWKSFTCANTAATGAAIVALRVIRNSEGCRATTTATTPTTRTTRAASPTRTFRIMVSDPPA